MLLVFGGVTTCALAAGAMVLNHRNASPTPVSATRTVAVARADNAAKRAALVAGPAIAPAQPTPAPDPNFVRVIPLKLPAAAAPEAPRVLQDLEGAYRCMHTGSKRSLAAWLPPGDAPTSAEELSQSMQRSLAKLPDACYVATALPQVINPRTPGPLMEVLLQDLDGRPDTIRLRTLFLIAGMQSHPRSGEALTNLQALLKIDYQRDWSRWDQAISDQLARDSHGLRGVSCRLH